MCDDPVLPRGSETETKPNNMKNSIFTRNAESQTTNILSASPASIKYWRSAADKIFAARPDVHSVEVVHSGNITDATHLPGKGARRPSEPGWAVIIASTGGRWGKSRRDYLPA
jgi:hypothetical protein